MGDSSALTFDMCSAAICGTNVTLTEIKKREIIINRSKTSTTTSTQSTTAVKTKKKEDLFVISGGRKDKSTRINSMILVYDGPSIGIVSAGSINPGHR